MRLEIKRDLFLLAFVCEDCTNEKYKTVRGDPIVELETLLGTGDRSQDRKTIDAGLDIRCGAVFLGQHR